MLYTLQTVSESGSFAQPDGTDVRYASNLRDLRWFLDSWMDDHDRVGSDSRDARLVVWKGRLPDVTDCYPDFELRPGPRGGIVRCLC